VVVSPAEILILFLSVLLKAAAEVLLLSQAAPIPVMVAVTAVIAQVAMVEVLVLGVIAVMEVLLELVVRVLPVQAVVVEAVVMAMVLLAAIFLTLAQEEAALMFMDKGVMEPVV
jgi:hypothetical protein